MKKVLLTNLIYGLLTIYCFGQNESIESKLMDCIYENRPGFKEVLYNYEQLLVSENILNDKSGMSYKVLLERIRIDKQFDYCPSKSYIDESLKLTTPNVDLIRDCQSDLLNEIGEQSLKVNKMINAINNLTISGNLNSSNIANEILSFLSENEFEHYYYREKILFLLDIICRNKK
jgi:hypothetical protein